MNEISEILGIRSDQIVRDQPNSAESEGGVDETDLELDRNEIETMALVAKNAVDAIDQLRIKSTNFEYEIRQLSQEMNVLESRSSSLHHRLGTREQALELLEPLLTEYAIPSQIISTIYEGEMDANWYNALERVRKPVNSENSNVKCVEGAQRLRKVLLLRAVERAKAFYIARLRMLRRPGVNSQKVQMEMIQGRSSMDLLRQETPRLASTLGIAYRNTMKWYYVMLFGKYGRWLNRQPFMAIESPQLLGAAIAHSRSGSLLSMGVSIKNVDSFTVGARPSALQASEDSFPALPMTATLSSSTPAYPIEVLVRSLLVTLADSFEIESKIADVVRPDTNGSEINGTSIVAEPPTEPLSPGSRYQGSLSPSIHASPTQRNQSTFTSPRHSRKSSFASSQSIELSFIDVFEPTLLFYGEVINGWIAQCTGDLFGLLIVVRLTDKSSLRSWIKPWLDAIAKKCWSHILRICEQQAESIEHAALKASTAASGKQASVGPHALTQLISTYLSGILQLCPEEPEPELASALKSIVEAYELFISKLANGKESVLYNNYYVMSALLGDIEGPLAKDFAGHFQLLVSAFGSQSG